MAELLSITEKQRQEVTEIIALLASRVSDNLKLGQVQQNGLLSGVAGQLLFLFNTYQFDQSLVDEAVFSDLLELLQDQLTDQSFELSNGLAGQAWVLEYFNQADEEDYDPQLLDDVDELFTQALDHDPWPGEIEMVLGLCGYAPYAARRAKFSKQHKLYNTIVTGLESTATYFENGHIAWSQPAQSVYRFDTDDREKPEFNLGLAHGVPGMIAALLPAHTIPSLNTRVTKLLSGACDWLIAHQNASGKENTRRSCYGSCAGSDEHSRLGWCYGDLTIAMILARAGKALDRPSYVDHALEVALHACKRDAEDGFINDAGVCHGFVGLALIFKLLDDLMPHPELKARSVYWVEYSLDKFRQEGIQALYSYNGIDKKHVEDFGFLMGYSGIGCALISLLNNDSSWTECLLMS
ncbi:lanthionine synthetase C family protein [Pseudoalteromonas luteoviolacea]|uniref:lanthionine synthetase C family protein n=1 Tax=Pseudoalteromonas luteoviolacea TaxID=43657 RepID=UPI001B386D1C|nr:lanthionine synthetase C family protein [Pseudoalteromonas luteoviolacea]MBQ4812678.1 lanthionine synthetase C family protein [Pseudoalteromonas luteoviolacea]